MNTDDDGSTKKKTDKPDSKTVTPEKKDSGEEEPKPRIVLTFRSEKSSARSSNMKIVPTEEKHEEVPRRSSRTRGKWEWICDSDTSPKKDKSAQNTSENDESDSSHTPKRSTRRRSKDSENILANAIARKEKSYETQSTPQRLSRRIKPTAKVLANEELRIGVESQNNARLGIPDKSPEEGVRTRRSARQDVEAAGQPEKKKAKPLEIDEVVEIGTDDDSQSQPDEMKLKHLCELGLKAVDTEGADESGNEIRDEIEEDVEAEDLEDDEIDDDPGVISKLLKTFDGAETDETSDEEFQCQVETKKKRQPRRSTRLMSTAYMNDSDQSMSEVIEEEPKSERQSRRRRVVSGDEEHSDAEVEQTSNPADAEEGSEAACPEKESTIVATCFCEAPSNVHAAPDDLTEPVFCQAVESVDEMRVGCSHRALSVDGTLATLRRAGPRAPYLLLCALHARQLDKHMCCSICGLFCTQGKFYQCSLGHLFHIECGLPLNDSKQALGCPHCGVHSYRWEPVNVQCARVRVTMTCGNKRLFLPEQREQCTPAYPTFTTQRKPEPILPENLSPLDYKSLKELLQGIEKLEGDSAQELRDAIVRGDSVAQLLPKMVPSSLINTPLDSEAGGTCAHSAARTGHVSAVCALQCAGALLDVVDRYNRTPLFVAVLALVGKLDLKEYTNKEDIKQENMEVDSELKTEDKSEQDMQTETEDNKSELDSVQKEIEESKTEQNAEEKETENSKTEQNEQKEVEDSKSKQEQGEEPSEEELLKLIQYLMIAGCDVNHQGPEQKTALHLCAQYGHIEGVRTLVRGADVSVQDRGGWTPLVWAADCNHVEVLKILLESGAEACSVDMEGNTALHWGAARGAGHAIQLLATAACSALHTHNVHGDTPLHIAARQGHYSCVVVLLALGARTDVKNLAGELPEHVCSGQIQGAISLNALMRQVAGTSSCVTLLASDISRGREPFPIPCVNEVDDATLPDDFTYVTRHVMPEHVEIDDTIATMQGCACTEGSCTLSKCACSSLCVRGWVRARRLLPCFPYADPPMLFECNQSCACDLRQCGNSIVSSLRGSVAVRCEVFRTAPRGWGLRPRGAVRAGELVATYCGELLPLSVADARADDRYVFALTLKQDLLEQCKHKTQLCIDAARYGGAARFINHSCAPNLAPVRVFTSSRDLRLPTVALFASRDILPNEELTFDYGDEFWCVKSKWMKCECGSIDCRYPTKTSD